MDRCGACHFPVSVADGEKPPFICRQCAMIADGETYPDGSSPAEDLSRGEVIYIGMRVTTIRRLHAIPALTEYVS